MKSLETARLIAPHPTTYDTTTSQETESVTCRSRRMEINGALARASDFLSGLWHRATRSSTHQLRNMSVARPAAYVPNPPDPSILASNCFSAITKELPIGMQLKVRPEAKRKFCETFQVIYTALRVGVPGLPYQFAARLANDFAVKAAIPLFSAPSQDATVPDGRSRLPSFIAQNMLIKVCENLRFDERTDKGYEERIFGEKTDAANEGPVMKALSSVLSPSGMRRYEKLKALYAERHTS